jgi:hypothetical protein
MERTRVLLSARLLRQLVLAALLLGGIGLAAVGASGLVAGGMGMLFGKSFVSGDAPGVTYTPDRCADFFEYAPRARTCQEAATIHHFGEVVDYRVAAGVLGLLALGLWWLLRRSRREVPELLPEGLVAGAGTAMFGAATAVLLLESIGLLAFGQGAGAGQYLSGALVALVMAAAFALSLYRALLHRARSQSSS